MHSITVITLHAFMAQASAKDSLDNAADLMVKKFVDRLVGAATESRVQNVDMDGTTLGKVHPDMGYAPTNIKAQPLVPSTVRAAQDKLSSYGIKPSPLQTLALTAIDANNRGIGMRNVAALASRLPSQTRADLYELQKDVVVKAAEIKEAEKLDLGATSKLEMSGITAPLGFYDPIGISNGIDDNKLYFYREAELKHGRVGMIASLGIFAGETFSPLFGATDIDTPAVQRLFVPPPAPYEAFWAAVTIALLGVELSSQTEAFRDPKSMGVWGSKSGRIPGDFGWDPLGLMPKKADEFKALQTKEINNGRLAMLAAAGMIAQEMVTGQKIFR